MTSTRSHLESLVEKAASAPKSEDAMRFAQAACNVSNAMATLDHIDRQPPATKPQE